MSIVKMLWICAALSLILMLLSLLNVKIAHPESVDTLYIQEEKVVVVCFDKKDCYLLDYKGLKKYSVRNDLTPKPTPAPYYPMGIPTPQP